MLGLIDKYAPTTNPPAGTGKRRDIHICIRSGEYLLDQVTNG